MGNRRYDIERYLRGELSPEEMHALEKEALKDPFLAEALEGIEQTGPDTFLYDLHSINRSIHDRARGKGRKRNKVIRMWGTVSAVAATIALAVASGFIVMHLLKHESRPERSLSRASDPAPATADSITPDTVEQLALSESTTPPEATSPVPAPRSQPRSSSGEAAQLGPVAEEPLVAQRSQEEDEPVAEREQDTRASDIAAAEKRAAIAQAERQAVTRADDATVAFRSRAPQADKVITGTVTDENGEALPGVNILIKGDTEGAVTDAEGRYTLPLSQDSATLVFNFIGFEQREVPVARQRELNVALEPEILALSEVIVTGYGVAKRSASSFQASAPETGYTGFRNYLREAIRYPAEAIKEKVEGKVTVRFTVEPNGELTDFEVIKGIGAGCEEELIRAIRQGPKWKAAMRDDTPVQDRIRVRYKFKLP